MRSPSNRLFAAPIHSHYDVRIDQVISNVAGMPTKIDLHVLDDLVSAERLRRKLERTGAGRKKRRIDVARLRKLTQGQAPLPYGIIEKMREDDRF